MASGNDQPVSIAQYLSCIYSHSCLLILVMYRRLAKLREVAIVHVRKNNVVNPVLKLPQEDAKVNNSFFP